MNKVDYRHSQFIHNISVQHLVIELAFYLLKKPEDNNY